MTLVYPAVFTPKKGQAGYEVAFPDLEQCTAEGPDLEDAIENAKEAAIAWVQAEMEDDGDLPAQTHIEDIALEENQFVKHLQLIIRSNVDYD